MNQNTFLDQIIQPKDIVDQNDRLSLLLEQQEKGLVLEDKLRKYISTIKTNNKLQTTLLGLILWQDNNPSISKEWKDNLKELKEEHFWEWDKQTAIIKKKENQVPFELLVRVFWGLLEYDAVEIHHKSKALFDGVDLVVFTGIVALRKLYLMDSPIDYFYSNNLSLFSKEEIISLQNELFM